MCEEVFVSKCELETHEMLHKEFSSARGRYCSLCNKILNDLNVIAFYKHLKDHQAEEKKAQKKKKKRKKREEIEIDVTGFSDDDESSTKPTSSGEVLFSGNSESVQSQNKKRRKGGDQFSASAVSKGETASAMSRGETEIVENNTRSQVQEQGYSNTQGNNFTNGQMMMKDEDVSPDQQEIQRQYEESGENYICPFCKAVCRGSAIGGHMKTHPELFRVGDNGRYQCYYCRSSFKSYKNLYEHLRTGNYFV
jgi:hypothetical protein